MNIEVKALDWNQVGYSDFVFEIYQDDQKSKRPQWYTNIDQIDLICFVNMKNYTAHFYHAKTLYKRFNAMEAQGCRMGVAHQNMDKPLVSVNVPQVDMVQTPIRFVMVKVNTLVLYALPPMVE